MKTQDGEPYTPSEQAPADAPQGPLNWASGQQLTSPLTRPVPDAFGHGLTSTPRGDAGQLSGVDAIVGRDK